MTWECLIFASGFLTFHGAWGNLGGAGFETEKEAKAGCHEVLADYGAAVPKIEVVTYKELPPLV